MLDSYGKLRVRAFTAGGALPVDNAVVKILGAEEANREVSYSLLTDRDGLTESVSLPAPNIDYSLIPSPAEAPYATYDIEIFAPGFYKKRINGISVFSGIESIQLVNMTPSTSTPIKDFPRGNINVIIPESDLD